MVIKTGNPLRDEVLRTFQTRVTPYLSSGQSFSKDELLDMAVSEVGSIGQRWDICRAECPPGDPELLRWCDKIILSKRKALKVAKVREINAVARLEEFSRNYGITCWHGVGGNSSLNLRIPLPNGQIIRLNLSFKRIEEDGFPQETLADLYKCLCDATGKLGRVVVKWN